MVDMNLAPITHETFGDLSTKLCQNNLNFDAMASQAKSKSATSDTMVEKHSIVEDEIVEFVLPDLPESETALCTGSICRLCGIKSEEATRTLTDLRDITTKINNLIPLSILQTDQLSKCVCSTCCDKINFINEFVTACQETEKNLSTMGKLVINEKMDRVETVVMQECPNCKVHLTITRICSVPNCQCSSKISLKVASKVTSDSRVRKIAGRSRNSRHVNNNAGVMTRLQKLSGRKTRAAKSGTEDMDSLQKKGEPVIAMEKTNSGKMKLRDIRKRTMIGDTHCNNEERIKTRKLESDALQNALFSVDSSLEAANITGEFVELETLNDEASTLACKSCRIRYSTHEEYLFHVDRHSSGNLEEYSCEVCHEKFTMERALWKHHKCLHSTNTDTLYDKIKKLQTECTRTFMKSTCAECGARFVLRERYEFHMERHKTGNIESFSCMICDKTFKSENILWDHHQYQHKFGERFACGTCDKTFIKSANLNHHLKSFGHKGRRTIVASDRTQQIDEMGKLTDANKPRPKIKCSECGARFVLQERYEFHMERHKSGQMEACVCTLCGKESTNENVLWDHYQYMHKRTKRYACMTCGKLFHKQSTLNRHQTRYGHKGAKEIDVETEGNVEMVDSAAFKKVIAEEVVEMKSVNCVLCGVVVWGVDPNLINDAVTCTSCEGPGLSLQVDSDGTKVISRRQYHCNMCTKHFTTKDRLEYHIMRHSENMDEFICSTCGKELSTEQALFEHYLFVHKGARPHVCELCGKSYQFKARLKEHMRSHSGERPFACEICGQRCMTNNALRSHKKTHITEKRFPCDICKKAFRRRQDLNEHLERHWKNDKTMMLPQVFNCAVCSDMFPTFRILKKHMKESHSVEGQDPMLSGLQPWFECEDCHEKFKHQMSLKVHRERAHEGKTRPIHHCDVCDVTYKNARVLSTHIKNKHQGGKRYKCAQCGKEYNQSTSLHNHILLHTGEKPFSCEHCEMQFRTKESRDYHQRKHTGERPYKCPKCNEYFATTTQRREHRKREHDEGNTHHCPECGKACFDEHGVRSHLTTHFADRSKTVQEN